jgi:murein DD-endopeptidase MepM/ murein hydrolase activator NlpD
MGTVAQRRLLLNYAARSPVIPQPSPPAMAGWAPRPGQVVAATWGYCVDAGTHYPYPAVDAFAPVGTPIWAPVSGISRPEVFPAGGYTTILHGDDGMFWYLAHGHVPFKAGRVTRGEPIGQVGNSGNARYTDPHVHFASAPDGDFNRGIHGGSGTVWFQPWVWGGR